MMSCLYRYWIKQFLKFFGIIQLIILVLFVFIDYLSRVGKFMETGLDLTGGLWFVLLKVPFMFVQFTPAAILLASIVVFSLMNRSNELLAIRSSGISAYYLVQPAIVVAGILAVLMFFTGETLIPVSMARANYIKYHIIKKQQNQFSVKRDIWIKSENKLIHINFYDPVKQSVSGITITYLGSGFSLDSRVDAKSGRFENGQWIFKDVIEQVYDSALADYRVTARDEKVVSLDLNPEDLGEIAKKSNEMSFIELSRYIKKIEGEGYDVTAYRVDRHAKIAFPLICIIMVLIGGATGMRPFARNNIPAAVGVGVILAFCYWITYGFCLSLGYGAVLPPLLSAWAANLFFLCFSILYVVYME